MSWAEAPDASTARPAARLSVLIKVSSLGLVRLV
jgi:hypothetical protein